MGAAICERMMATRPIRGAALLAPVPPSGLLSVAARLATRIPNYASHMLGLDPMRLSDDILKALRPFYFSDRVDPAILREALFHLKGESPRVLFDLALRLHWALPPSAPSPVFVMGADGRPDLDSGRYAGHREASPRRGHDPAGHGAHADAGARVEGCGGGARGVARQRRLISPRWRVSGERSE